MGMAFGMRFSRRDHRTYRENDEEMFNHYRLSMDREIQSDGRIRRWARISGFENRALRVILLEDGVTVHNAFFDRRYEEEQI